MFFELIKPNTKIDFVGRRNLFVGISLVLMLGTLAAFFTKGLNYGIDFTGGAEVQVKVPSDWQISNLRDALEKGGLKSFKVQQVGLPQDSTYFIKAQGDEHSLNQISAQVETILKTTVPGGTGYEIQRVDVVGPAAGESLRMSGFLSMFYAFVCILLYVAIRFDARYAPGAVLALIHDSVITIGIFILMQKQFDLQILAAILALIGYSNNDTIIVYDRVRETLHQRPDLDIHEAVNISINETLGRTIMTSLSTFLTVFALWCFGGKALEDFAFTLMIGIIVGTYSSIFIASAFVVYMTDYTTKREAKLKASGKYGKKKRNYAVRSEPKFQQD